MQRIFTILLFFAGSCLAQNAAFFGSNAQLASSPPFVLISHTSQAQTGAYNDPITTPSINATGANSCFVGVSTYAISVPSGVSCVDSGSVSYTAVPMVNGSGPVANVGIFYLKGMTGGSGYTVTCSGTQFAAIAIACFSGGISTGGADQENDAVVTSSATAQAGSVTPGNDAQLIINVAGGDSQSLAASTPINSGFTMIEKVAQSGGNYSLGLSYLIQTTATAENPQVTFAASTGFIEIMNATFKSH